MGEPVRQAFVGIGTNLGDRTALLDAAVAALRGERGVLRLDVSPVFETEPVGFTEQPRFLNAVFGLETTLSPEDLLHTLQRIELRFGRERTVRWGPRTLDLDLLAFEGEGRDTEELTLPHPRLFERAFVLVPLRLLLQKPRYDRAPWDEFRRRVDSAPVETTGIAPWTA